jgi:uncharacterized membrane protein YfcA
VGGGVILVPGLALVAGLPLRSAVAASLVCVVATSVAGSVVNLRRQRIDLTVAVPLQFYAVLGAVIAGALAAFIAAGPLYLAFALLLLHAAWQMRPRPGDAVLAPKARASTGSLVPASGASFFAGAVSALLGVGGGVIFTPLLHVMLGRSFERAAATSVYMIGVTSAVGSLVYMARGDVSAVVAATTMLGVLAGAAAASVYGHHIDHRALKLGFAILLVYTAIRMVLRGLAQL